MKEWILNRKKGTVNCKVICGIVKIVYKVTESNAIVVGIMVTKFIVRNKGLSQDFLPNYVGNAILVWIASTLGRKDKTFSKHKICAFSPFFKKWNGFFFVVVSFLDWKSVACVECPNPRSETNEMEKTLKVPVFRFTGPERKMPKRDRQLMSPSRPPEQHPWTPHAIEPRKVGRGQTQVLWGGAFIRTKFNHWKK